MRLKLDGFTGIIEFWLEEDRRIPHRQPRTAELVLALLRDEHGFAGG
jgi:hypothetical protein